MVFLYSRTPPHPHPPTSRTLSWCIPPEIWALYTNLDGLCLYWVLKNLYRDPFISNTEEGHCEAKCRWVGRKISKYTSYPTVGAWCSPKYYFSSREKNGGIEWLLLPLDVGDKELAMPIIFLTSFPWRERSISMVIFFGVCNFTKSINDSCHLFTCVPQSIPQDSTVLYIIKLYSSV